MNVWVKNMRKLLMDSSELNPGSINGYKERLGVDDAEALRLWEIDMKIFREAIKQERDHRGELLQATTE